MKKAIQVVRKDIEWDIAKAKEKIEANNWKPCSCCGSEFLSSELQFMSKQESVLCKKRLHQRIYGDRKNIKACSKCEKELRRGKIPMMALCQGWNLDESIPKELSCLNQHEVLLISLRLPCIPVWRHKSYGRKVSSGFALSYSNPVSDLAERLPRRPRVVLKC